MTARLLNSAEDMKWLRDVHTPGLDAKYLSAVIEGNLDCPSRIDVFEQVDPSIRDEAVTLYPVQGGDLKYAEPECAACKVKGELHLIGGSWLCLSHADVGFSSDTTGEKDP